MYASTRGLLIQWVNNKIRPRDTSITISIMVAGMLLAGNVRAQITPGQVGDTLKRPTELKQPQQAPPLEKPKQAAPAAAAGGRRIQISSFEFIGNTIFSSDKLASLLTDYLNKTVTLLDIYAAADRVTDFYSDNGYSLASVNVPPQKITGGIVRLEVSEGRIGQVLVEGNENYAAAHIVEYLGEVKPGTIYRGQQVEQGMQQLNELPGLRARAVVKPGAEYGSTDLVVKAEETPFSGTFFVDNSGRKNIGETRYAVNMNFNNPAGIEDQLTLLGLTSSDGLLNYQFASYSLPLNFSGSRLNMSYGHAAFEVSATPVNGRSDNGRISVEQPLLRERNDRLDLSVGASRTLSASFLNNAAGTSSSKINGTSITLFEIGAIYNHVYSDLSVTQLTASLASNFDRADFRELHPANGIVKSADQRIRVELDVQHLQAFDRGFFALAHFNGVYSPNPLADVSQYSIGGPQSIRGYPASEVRGDRGYFGQLTLARRFDLGPFKMTGRVFADSGKVFCAGNIPCSTQAAGPPTLEDSLTSVGFGADALYDRVTMKFDWGFPRDEHPVSDGRIHGRLFGSLYVSF